MQPMFKAAANGRTRRFIRSRRCRDDASGEYG